MLGIILFLCGLMLFIEAIGPDELNWPAMISCFGLMQGYALVSSLRKQK
jgi:hypothetical protein